MKEDSLLLVFALTGYLFFTIFYTVDPADLRECLVYGPTPEGVSRCIEWRKDNE